MDSKPKWPYRQLADGYNFVDAASTGFDGAVLMIGYRFFFPVSSSFRNRKSKKREAGRKSEKEETK